MCSPHAVLEVIGHSRHQGTQALLRTTECLLSRLNSCVWLWLSGVHVRVMCVDLLCSPCVKTVEREWLALSRRTERRTELLIGTHFAGHSTIPETCICMCTAACRPVPPRLLPHAALCLLACAGPPPVPTLLEVCLPKSGCIRTRGHRSELECPTVLRCLRTRVRVTASRSRAGTHGWQCLLGGLRCAGRCISYSVARLRNLWPGTNTEISTLQIGHRVVHNLDSIGS